MRESSAEHPSVLLSLSASLVASAVLVAQQDPSSPSRVELEVGKPVTLDLTVPDRAAASRPAGAR